MSIFRYVLRTRAIARAASDQKDLQNGPSNSVDSHGDTTGRIAMKSEIWKFGSGEIVNFSLECLAEFNARTGEMNRSKESHRSSSNCPPDHVLANLRNFNEGEYPAAPPHQAR